MDAFRGAEDGGWAALARGHPLGWASLGQGLGKWLTNISGRIALKPGQERLLCFRGSPASFTKLHPQGEDSAGPRKGGLCAPFHLTLGPQNPLPKWP